MTIDDDVNDVIVLVEKWIAEGFEQGKPLSADDMAFLRSWPAKIAAGDPHPWYGPCDTAGLGGQCAECADPGQYARPIVCGRREIFPGKV